MKQIYCPKCRTGYEIDENLIPEDGKSSAAVIAVRCLKPIATI